MCNLLLEAGAIPTAIVAVMVALLGWFGKSVVGWIVHIYRRQANELELMAALEAEIEINKASTEAFAAASLVDGYQANLDRDSAHKLFIPSCDDNFVFDNIQTNITRLPKFIIKDVVAFYNSDEAFAALLKRMEGKTFQSFPPERRVAIFRAMTTVAAGTTGKAERALSIIKRETIALEARQAIIAGLAVIAIVAFVWLFLAGMQSLGPCAQTSGGKIGRDIFNSLFAPNIGKAVAFDKLVLPSSSARS
jgi:hypothetical protein